MSVTMHPMALHHMVVSSHQLHADLSLWQPNAGGEPPRHGGHPQATKLPLARSAPLLCWAAALCGSLGSNAEIRRSVLACKIGRFVDGKTAYPVEVSVCGRQLREPLLPHTGHDKGIVRQQPVALPHLGACLHNVKRERENG